MGWLSGRRDKNGPVDSAPAAAEVAQPALVYLDVLHRQGLQAKERGDIPEAERCFAQAALDGNPKSANALAEMFDADGDEAAAAPWYELAADGGVMSAAYNLGVNLTRSGDKATAESWYRRAADAGFVLAQNNLGVLLMERGDLVEARHWLQLALNNGDNVAGQALAHLDRLERGGDYGISIGSSRT